MNQCYISGVGTVARIMLHYFVTKRTYYGRVIIRFSGSKDKVLGSQVLRGEGMCTEFLVAKCVLTNINVALLSKGKSNIGVVPTEVAQLMSC